MNVTANRWQANAGRMMYQASLYSKAAAGDSKTERTGNLPEEGFLKTETDKAAGNENTPPANTAPAENPNIAANAPADKTAAEKAEENADKAVKEKTGEAREQAGRTKEDEELSALKRLAESLSAQNAKKGKKNGFQMKSSSQEESVGELAALLARAETRFDVLQVSGKAMRALVNLKMSSVSADKDEAKKIAQKIRRMEKLIKRIQKKLKQLSKEEDLERQRQRAAKKEEMQKAKELQEELQSRRKKRRKDERNYAFKELSRDQKGENDEMLAEAFGSDGSVSPDLSSMIETGGVSLSSALEGVSIDIMA